MHDLSLIITLTGGLAAAVVFGWITRRLGQSTLLGYMLAGIVVGPHTPGFVADARVASQMAEIGVILLMFGVGLHFHPGELLRVWRLAVPGAVAQSAVAAVAGWAVARWLGWSDAAGLVFGMSLAVASTVVLMKVLIERERLSARDGHVAVGWLIVEDLFTVAALVVLPVIALPAGAGARESQLGVALAVAMLKAGAFVAIAWIIGTRLASALMERMAKARSPELFTLVVFTLALGIAIVAAVVFDVSVALGAFFAGLVVGQSRFGPQAMADIAPFRDVFAALFFVSVGMLFNPLFVLEQPLVVAAALGIVLVIKPLVAYGIVLLLRDTRRVAATVGVGLAQIGEFSFILASLGGALGVLPAGALDALVVAAIVSISINPLLFRVADRWANAGAEAASRRAGDEAPAVIGHAVDGRTVEVVVAGHGALGQSIARRCAEVGNAVCAIDSDVDNLEADEARDYRCVFGDATRPQVLVAAGIEQASVIVIAGLELAAKMQVCSRARELNARIRIVAAAANGGEASWLREFGAEFVCDALEGQTEELARSVRAAL
jgi:CPA2 family monovalent cation:H+ antiporter-2